MKKEDLLQEFKTILQDISIENIYVCAYNDFQYMYSLLFRYGNNDIYMYTGKNTHNIYLKIMKVKKSFFEMGTTKEYRSDGDPVFSKLIMDVCDKRVTYDRTKEREQFVKTLDNEKPKEDKKPILKFIKASWLFSSITFCITFLFLWVLGCLLLSGNYVLFGLVLFFGSVLYGQWIIAYAEGYYTYSDSYEYFLESKKNNIEVQK